MPRFEDWAGSPEPMTEQEIYEQQEKEETSDYMDYAAEDWE